ncbi:hypothetical protein CF328_g1732 [Tilletia controversa]|nr:hypothetical protein CF328_g1732 [Tilletia controversa]
MHLPLRAISEHSDRIQPSPVLSEQQSADRAAFESWAGDVQWPNLWSLSIPYPVTQVVAALARYHPEAWLLITSGDRTTLDHRNLISFASSSATVHPQTQSLPQTSCLISTVSGAHHEQDPRH